LNICGNIGLYISKNKRLKTAMRKRDMFHNQKKFTVLALFFLGMGVALFVGINSLLMIEKKAPSSSQAYSQSLTDYENEVWKELESVGITKKACQKKQDRSIQELRELTQQEHTQNGKQEVAQETTRLVHAVLHDFGINPQSINIEGHDDPKHVAGSNEITIIINESLLKTLSPLAQKFVIGHELQHMIHADNSMKSIVHDYLESLANYDEHHKKRAKKAELALSRFCEWRADIKTALINDTYAQGYIEFMENRLEHIGDKGGSASTHPKCSERLLIAHAITDHVPALLEHC
jgi:hypothetical protein